MPPTIALPTIWRMWVRAEAVTGTAESLRIGFVLSAADVAQAKRWAAVAGASSFVDRCAAQMRAGARFLAAEPGGSRAAPDAPARVGVDVELVEQGLDPAHALGDLRAAARQEAVAAELEQLGAEHLERLAERFLAI